jgi:transposase
LELSKISGYTIDGLLKLTDEQLNDIINPGINANPQRLVELKKLFPVFDQKLRRPGMTKTKLWAENYKEYPDGYCSTQFLKYYNQWRKAKKPTLRMIHKPGDKMYIDYTGQKMRIIDKVTGEKTEVEVFVAILGASQYTYVEASGSQRLEYFIKSVENALHYFGGVPEVIVPDNLKSAVTKSHRYEPKVNESFNNFAEHYATFIFPARAYKPKDKALAENAVGISYSKIFAPLDKKVFFTLEALNKGILELLVEYNSTPLAKLESSRKELFDEYERATLSPLPPTRYDMRYTNPSTVYQNCHVYLREDKHYYSVPYMYLGKTVKVVYTQNLVEIYYKYKLLTTHGRDRTIQGFTTRVEHLHEQHQYFLNQSPEKFIESADKVGTYTREMIIKILETSHYADQAYRSCAGVLRLQNRVGNIRLENACRRALEFEAYTCTVVERILAKDLDKYPEPGSTNKKLPNHKNIRGEKGYK